jgi:alpha-tubulin suppressor-like RCC1 family protein
MRLRWRQKLVWSAVLVFLSLGLTQGATASATVYPVQAWGSNGEGNLGRGGLCEGMPAFNPPQSDVPLGVPGLTEAKGVAVGTNDVDYDMAILKSGKVTAWGENAAGQLGLGLPGTGPLLCGWANVAYSSTPDLVVGLTKVKAIAAGPNHALALLTNGKVMAWGSNSGGDLGIGTITGPEECETSAFFKGPCSSKPVEVSGLKEVKAIAAGAGYSLALLKDGKVMAWGGNGAWALGREDDGTAEKPEYSDVPLEVPGLSEVKAIAAGWNHALALLKNGTVEAWGSNGVPEYGGDLGQETFAQESILPTPVKGFGKKKAKAISAGREWSLAAITDGTARAWGNDEEGSLGTGCNAELEGPYKCSRDIPTPVNELTNVAKVNAGEYNGMAILKDGTVKSWGFNGSDQLGDGHEGGVTWSPVSVYGLTGVVAVSMGDLSALALG